MRQEHGASARDSWADYISTIVAEQNETQRTAYTAMVIGVNSLSSGSVTIRIMDKRISDEGENMDSADVLNVPIYWPRTSSSEIYFPIKVGDLGVCIVCDNNIDNFKGGQGTVAAEVRDNRTKDVMDSIFIPGVQPFGSSSKLSSNRSFPKDLNDLVVSHNIGSGAEVNLTLKADGNAEIRSAFTVRVISKDIELTASNSLNITAQSLSVNVPNSTWTGITSVTGEWTVNNIPVSTHVHLGVTPGNGTSGLPTV